MAATEVASFNWPVLLPVVVGGLLTLVGGSTPPIISHWLSSRAERANKHNERLEALINALYEHDRWLDIERQGQIWKGTEQGIAEPIQKATALAALYFPTLITHVKAVATASSAYKVWIFKAAAKRVQQDNPSTWNDGFEEAYAPYYTEFRNAVDAISDYAARRTKKAM